MTVVDPSADSIDLLKERAADAGITNITAINEQWEDANVPAADLVLCSLVLHHVSEPAPFVARLQQHASNRVAVLGDGPDAGRGRPTPSSSGCTVSRCRRCLGWPG